MFVFKIETDDIDNELIENLKRTMGVGNVTCGAVCGFDGGGGEIIIVLAASVAVIKELAKILKAYWERNNGKEIKINGDIYKGYSLEEIEKFLDRKKKKRK